MNTTAAHAETGKDRDALQVQLRAWQTAFGTTQLTHALAKLEEAEKTVQRSRAKWERLKRKLDEMPIRNDFAIYFMNRLDAEEKETAMNDVGQLPVSPDKEKA